MSSISVSDAVKSAKELLRSLYEDDPPDALALEEIEFIQDSTRPLWAVTFGFHRQLSILPIRNTGIAEFLGQREKIENRVYKKMLIDANTGEFVKMDMRQVQ